MWALLETYTGTFAKFPNGELVTSDKDYAESVLYRVAPKLAEQQGGEQLMLVKFAEVIRVKTLDTNKRLP